MAKKQGWSDQPLKGVAHDGVMPGRRGFWIRSNLKCCAFQFVILPQKQFSVETEPHCDENSRAGLENVTLLKGKRFNPPAYGKKTLLIH